MNDELLDVEVVILLQGNNLSDNRIYSYLKLTGGNLKKMFACMQAEENFRPADFGTVVATGGGVPSQEIHDKMKAEYNMVDVPELMPEPEK